jgi:hypothetical protein
MTRRSPFPITLSAADRGVLEKRVRAYTAPFATVVPAKDCAVGRGRRAQHPDCGASGCAHQHGDHVAQNGSSSLVWPARKIVRGRVGRGHSRRGLVSKGAPGRIRTCAPASGGRCNA